MKEFDGQGLGNQAGERKMDAESQNMRLEWAAPWNTTCQEFLRKIKDIEGW